MIFFKSIKWSNFLSTGSQPTEIFLNKAPTTLIVGENGAGKSTILDALCYALFNKPFRDINKPQLINSINNKKCIVEIEFSIGKKDYKIVRGMKPTVFEIYLNGELLNQDAASRDYQKYLEEHVLKLNYKSFTQIVILGSASFTPFMQLTTINRREIIEDLLDIKVFSVMNEVLKLKHSEIKSKIQSTDSDIDICKAKIKLQQDFINSLEVDKDRRKNENDVLIEEAGNRIKQLSKEIDAKAKEKEEIEETIEDEKTILQKDRQLKQLSDKLKDKRKKTEEEILFYQKNDTCPTCSQDLPDDFKSKTVNEHEAKIQEIDDALKDIASQQAEIETRIDEINAAKEVISQIKDDMLELNSNVIAEQNYVKKLMKENQDESGNTANIDEEKAKIKLMAKEVLEKTKERSDLIEERGYYDLASMLLKDTGIKTKIIKQYLPVMNKIINKYLQAMDFFVHFELDEAFNETIKSRHRDEFSYASFSEGEKQRIDLALLFAWRNIAKTKNSTNTNLLILDEVFDSSLDTNGADLLYQILGTIDSKTNVFVISHKDALFDKFRSVIKFGKQNNFSQIVK